jgi:hypothetical protein
MLGTPQNKTATALWPANQIEHWPIDRLVPYARNARTHTDAQIAQLADWVGRFRFLSPRTARF